MTSRFLRARSLVLAFAVTVVAALSATPALAATASQADITGIEAWAAAVALGEVGQVETSTDRVAYGTRGYGDFGGAWCADFYQWVLERSSIPYNGGGRGAFSYRIARNWGIFGQRGYGRKRPGTALDAMPGDIIVHNDPNNGVVNSTGGHVSMVVKATDNPAIVWTVGGNESNGVRLRQTNLTTKGPYTYPRYLVTITEMRFPAVDLVDRYSGTKLGYAQLERTGGGYGPLVKVNGLTRNGTVYTASQINSNYRFMAINRDTGITSSFAPTSWISTVNYRNIRLVRTTSATDTAQISYAGANLSGKPVTGGW